MSCFVLVTILVALPYAQPRGPEYNEAVLKDRRICPDVIPIKDCPGERVEVAWAHANLTTGQDLGPNDVVECPDEVKHVHQLEALYVIIMTDPDVPSRENPTKREYLHWLVGNIYQDNWHTGETIVDYIGAIPEHMNGVHRMVFLAYKQPSTDFIRFEERRLGPEPHDKDRANFSSTKFAKKYNLTGPVAANFFMAHWTQDMVKTLKKPTTSTTEDPIEYHEDENKDYNNPAVDTKS